MRVAVVFDTPYSGWDHLEHERQMDSEVASRKTNEPEMEYQIAHALHEQVESQPDLSFPLIVKPLQADASAGISLASVVQDVDALAERVHFISYGHDMANAAAKAGMEYYDFIQRIVDAAVARYERA